MSPASASTEANPSTAFALYWDKLAAYLRFACALFGDPAALAKRLWLSHAEHKQCADFLRPLEAIARRLIFALALELAPATHPPAPERKQRPLRGMPANVGAAFDMDRPESWRAPFQLVTTRARRPRATPSPAHQAIAADRLSSAPLAARFEALRRAYENRDAYAAALARKHARAPAIAYAFLVGAPAARAHRAGYATLADLVPLMGDAFQRALHRKLDALLPNTS